MREDVVSELPLAGLSLRIPIQQEVQGSQQSFEFGASVEYPQGKGKRLRFRDDVLLRTNTEFGNSFGTALTVAAALGGAIMVSSPATVTIAVTSAAVDKVPFISAASSTLIWKLGDPPITQMKKS